METNVEETKLEYSGLGIAAFTLGLLSFVGFFALLILGGYFAYALGYGYTVGILFFLDVVMSIVGLVFGIVAVCQKNVKKVFGVIGLAFSVVTIFLVILVLIVGLSIITG